MTRSGTGTSALALTVVTALVLGLAVGALAQDDSSKPIIRIGSLYEPQNLDNTAGAGQGINEAFNGNVYEALFKLTDEGEVVDSLVKDYSISDDGLTYTFNLRPDVSFHSGVPLTAADVKWSIGRVTAEDSQSSRKSSLANIESVETPDENTVIIHLSERSISLPYNLSYVWIVNDTATDLSTSEDGTGPYVLEKWRRGSSLSLKPNENYWGDQPSNGGVVLNYFTEATALNNALLTGAVDIITSVQSPDLLAQFTDNPNFTVKAGQSTTKEVLAFNDRVEPFDKIEVRKAIARGINDEQLLRAIWGDYGSLIGSFVPPTDPWYVDLTDVDPYDPESAKKMLADAGYPNGFTFTLDTPNYDPHPIVAQFVQNELAKIGVTVNINIITANEWYTKIYQAHDFEATLQEHVNHRDIVFYGNPDFYWGYDNKKVQDLINSSETSDTVEERNTKLEQANRTIAEDAASDWLYLYPQIVVSTVSVTGYPVNGLNSQFFAYNIVKSTD